MNVIYKQNELIAWQYIELERRMGQQETSYMQAARALMNSNCVISAAKW